MIQPDYDSNRVPMCSEDRCPSYDGKRCAETGFRPDRICEPSVILMVRALRKPCPACDAQFVDSDAVGAS